MVYHKSRAVDIKIEGDCMLKAPHNFRKQQRCYIPPSKSVLILSLHTVLSIRLDVQEGCLALSEARPYDVPQVPMALQVKCLAEGVHKASNSFQKECRCCIPPCKHVLILSLSAVLTNRTPF